MVVKKNPLNTLEVTRVAGTLALAVACGGRADSALQAGLEGDFVAVRKALTAKEEALPITGMPSASEDFYIAIDKRQLGTRWFLSAFMKQFHPDNLPLLQELGIYDTDRLIATSPLGTRVVSFAIQNDRLYMFDASDRYRETALQDPTVLIEAYPIVESPEFSALPGSEDYVLFDPSQGLNAYRLTGVLFADPFLDYAAPASVGLTYSQNFRVLPDGVAFEEVFSGEFDLGGDAGALPAWGTLGIALRRYREGEFYQPTPEQPYFFSNWRYASDDTGQIAKEAVHWDFHPGMTPVQIFVSAGAERAQAAYPDVDILGAIRRGIESWNDAFGFPVFEAVFTGDDVLRDDGSSFLVVDYPGPNGTARGGTQVNPNTGEIYSANIYLASGVFAALDALGLGSSEPAPAARDGSGPEVRRAAPATQGAARRTLGLSWSGMSAPAATCERLSGLGSADSSVLGGEGAPEGGSLLEDTPLPEQGKAWVQAFVAHEVGHTVGLAHNFKGSLVAPGGTSVMDYQGLRDSVAQPTPGTYDIAAIRYLYHLSDELPTDPFCSDLDIAFDPTCRQYDEEAEPLSQFWGPLHALQVDALLDLGGGVEQLTILNEVLAFARDADPGFVAPETRVAAVQLALGRAAVPLSEADAAVPETVAQANRVAEAVLRRAVLDAPELRGDSVFEISDPGALAVLIEQAGLVLRNGDGVRSFAVRRTAVDVLAALQSDAALVELRSSNEAIAAAADAPLSDTDRQLTVDLIARIGAALDPYFR